MRLTSVICIVLLMLSVNRLAASESDYQGLTNLGWQWVSAADKKALICDISHWHECLQQLSSTALAQLDFSPEYAENVLGRQEAMVLSVKESQHAGVILLAPSLVQALEQQVTEDSAHKSIDKITKKNSEKSTSIISIRQASISVAGKYYSLILEHQAQLTLWHELGHLENIALQGSILPIKLSAYQHEWLADVYTLWRSLKETGKLDLAWQQYHRRNMALINDIANLSHWSAPQLLSLLSEQPERLQLDFEQYSNFIAFIYPKLMQLDESTLAEYSSLVQRTFGAGAVQSLPHYMFWRQQELALWLRPTLGELMGEKQAELWLKAQFSAL
ncbi:hypothetical protein [Shewanella sp.]|uniref:hypothetical protein n=1 Tax=Shewanella sp. TaxID=50422 RepID=UPI0040545A2E